MDSTSQIAQWTGNVTRWPPDVTSYRLPINDQYFKAKTAVTSYFSSKSYYLLTLYDNAAVKRQAAVIVYFSSEQLLLFAFTSRYSDAIANSSICSLFVDQLILFDFLRENCCTIANNSNWLLFRKRVDVINLLPRELLCESSNSSLFEVISYRCLSLPGRACSVQPLSVLMRIYRRLPCVTGLQCVDNLWQPLLQLTETWSSGHHLLTPGEPSRPLKMEQDRVFLMMGFLLTGLLTCLTLAEPAPTKKEEGNAVIMLNVLCHQGWLVITLCFL